MEPTFNPKDFSQVYRSRAVEQIYQSPSNNNFSQFDKKAKKNTKGLLYGLGVAFLILIAVFTWLGYRLFSPHTGVSQSAIYVHLVAPEKAASGEVVHYRVEYGNTDKNPVINATVLIEYPTGFVFTESNPQPQNDLKTRWDIGLLKGGDKGVIEISGQLRGTPDEDKHIKVTMSYKPTNFNSEFDTQDEATTKLATSLFSLAMKGPNQIGSGQEVTYEVTYNNFSQIQNSDQVQLKMVYPDGFAFSESTPKPDFGQDVWSAQTLLAQLSQDKQEASIIIKGTFQKNSSGSKTITAGVGFVSGDTLDMQQQQNFVTEVVAGDVSVSLSVNGSSSDQVVHLGDTLSYSAHYENKGTSEVIISTMKVHIDAVLVDWTTIHDEHGGKYTDGEIAWTGQEIPSLSRLAPGEKGDIAFTVKVKDANAIATLRQGGFLDKQDSFKIKSYIALQAQPSLSSSAPTSAVVLSDQPNETKSGVITNTVVTDLSFSSQARYFNDQSVAIGSGPLPPHQGQVTTYQIVWTVQNTVQDVNGLRVTTTLSPDVSWTAKFVASAGDLVYNPETKMVTWTINKLPAKTGKITAQFEVSITPAQNQVNKLMSLVGDSTLTATDSANNTPLSLIQKALTTNLDFDPLGKGKGLIQQ